MLAVNRAARSAGRDDNWGFLSSNRVSKTEWSQRGPVQEVHVSTKPVLFSLLAAIDALIVTIAVGFFLIGLGDGSVSSDNIGLWIGILAGLGAFFGGGLWLRRLGHPRLGTLLLLVLAVPGLLYGVFIVVLLVSDTPWN